MHLEGDREWWGFYLEGPGNGGGAGGGGDFILPEGEKKSTPVFITIL